MLSAKLPAKRKSKHTKRQRTDPYRPEGWQGGPLPGWGVEMPYSTGSRAASAPNALAARLVARAGGRWTLTSLLATSRLLSC